MRNPKHLEKLITLKLSLWLFYTFDLLSESLSMKIGVLVEYIVTWIVFTLHFQWVPARRMLVA